MHNIYLIGVGLIGGSLALNLKEIYPNSQISGFGRNIENLKSAQKCKIIDKISTDISEIQDVDLVIIATPVGAFASIIDSIKPYLKNQLIIDVGSTKSSIVKIVNTKLPNFKRFVPTHPIAGKESSGAKNADISLFANKKLIICPMSNNSQDDINLVSDFWQKSGAIVEIMEVGIHDNIFALTSHTPHLVAFAFMHLMAKHPESLFYSGGGLKDFSRIAGSDGTMWADISKQNKDFILQHLTDYIDELQDIKNIVACDNYDELLNYFATAKSIREKLD